ncbi:MAG: hypothetical protein AAGF55_05295 [Pseudomonadota bacterium]
MLKHLILSGGCWRQTLSEKSRGLHEERLAPLSSKIESFVPVLEKIDTACLEHDFIGLDAQIDALAAQMKRG